MTTTIAVIEDELTIATAVAARLRAEGIGVELAHDGPTGVALCERIQPDVVILDLMLPTQNLTDDERRNGAAQW